MGMVNSETHSMLSYTGTSSSSYGMTSPPLPQQPGGMFVPPQLQQYYGGDTGLSSPPQGQVQEQQPVRGRFSNLLKKTFIGKAN